MGFIVLTQISFATPPSVVQIGDVYYKLAASPDVPGNYTLAHSNVGFNADGSIVGGPRTISGLTNGVNYTVKVILDCGLAYWTKNIAVPGTTTTTTTTSTTTTSGNQVVTINFCADKVSGLDQATGSFFTDFPVATDVQIFFRIYGPGGNFSSLTTIIFAGNSSRNWGPASFGLEPSVSSIDILSITPTSFGSQTYVEGTFSGGCAV